MHDEPRTPYALREPTVRYLYQVLEEIRAGQILIPRFQRPLVWLEDRQLELLRSIREGIPIGSVMVWLTSRPMLPSYATVGAHTIPQAAAASPHQYLLDGVQRMTTLLAALYQPPGTTASRYGFDFQSDDFVILDEDDPDVLPLSSLVDSIQLIKSQKRLVDRAKPEAWITTSDNLARTFREYKLPVVPVAGDDLSRATKTFQRVNSQGVPMSEVHMVHALSWSESFDLLEVLSELRSRVMPRWQDLSDEVIFRVLRLMNRLDPYRGNVERLAAIVKDPKRPLVEAVKAVGRAVTFLETEMQILGPKMLPYELQLVVLASVLPSSGVQRHATSALLVGWIWLSSYAELFASINGVKVVSIRDALQMDIAASERGEPTTLSWPVKRRWSRAPLTRFDFRSARTRALALLMANRGPLRMDGEKLDAHRLLAELGTDAFVRGPDARGVEHAGPRFLLPAADIGSLDSLLRESQSSQLISREVLDSHRLAHFHDENIDIPTAYEKRRHFLESDEAAHEASWRQLSDIPRP